MTLDTLKGSIVVVSFFTRCPDVCPALALKFIELEEQVPDTIGDVPIHFISITVDPKLIAQKSFLLTKKICRCPERWQLWTGETNQIDATVQEFQLGLERSEGTDGPAIVHSERFVVLDPKGHIRNFYPSDEMGLSSRLNTYLSWLRFLTEPALTMVGM